MTEAMPQFQLIEPSTVDEAVAALQDAPGAVLCAGGTDLVVQLRQGLSDPGTLVNLSGVAALSTVEETNKGLRVGAGVTLAEIAGMEAVANGYPAVAKAAQSVAGPSHREVATLGGNLCLDTRCVYFNQSHWWRKSNSFCLKNRGDICHVAPKGNRCRAAFSGDMAPALMVHGAEIEIAGANGVRRIALADFYHEDGAEHINLEPCEIVVAAHLPPPGPTSDYEKIRVRGSIDFPLAGVAVACNKLDDGTAQFTVAVTGTNSKPLLVELPGDLNAEEPNDAFFATLEKQVQKAVSPQRTTTIAPHYRRLSVSALTVRLAEGLL
ncbi:MAG: 4-hydroxybenzoyl-CoA reductase subunit beta [Rhodobacteraceae bacterium]|nr:4-hydroxybenzoyl-CoA reductase subunit beta [Paracoccaceae bacterium]